MLAAGSESTFTTLEWGMTELVRNPEVLKKLQEEVRGIVNRDSMINEEDLSKMSYLKAVIKEILRLHPPAPLLVPRESMQACQIQGYEIPVHARVIVNAWALGRDPDSWEAPEEFRPERFLGSNIDFKGHDFQFIPFGAGRRFCPGMQFAVSNLELAIANLVHLFDWELPEGMQIEDLDMTEAAGLTSRRKQNLCLVAKPGSL